MAKFDLLRCRFDLLWHGHSRHDGAARSKESEGGVAHTDSRFCFHGGLINRDPPPQSPEIGDILVIYSDGLTDAQHRADEEFGEERLRNLIRLEGSAGAATLKKNLLVGIDEFTAGANQVDDITFTLVERGA